MLQLPVVGGTGANAQPANHKTGTNLMMRLIFKANLFDERFYRLFKSPIIYEFSPIKKAALEVQRGFEC
jgi:hypothetical protein